MEIQPYQQRVLDERNELQEKRKKLLSFIESETFQTLDSAEQGLMIGQSHAMGHYTFYLNSRLGLWGIE